MFFLPLALLGCCLPFEFRGESLVGLRPSPFVLLLPPPFFHPFPGKEAKFLRYMLPGGSQGSSRHSGYITCIPKPKWQCGLKFIG